MNKKYITVEQLENYLNLDIDVAFESQVEEWIIAMSDYVALATNREWLADTVETTRYFSGNGCQALEVGDFIESASFEIQRGSEYLTDMQVEDDYILYPYNTTTKNTIILKDKVFSQGIQNIQVTAKWGYLAEVPKDIQQAVTILTAGIVLAQTNQEGEVESEKIGNYTVKYSTTSQKTDFDRAKDIIENRRLIRI